MILPPSTSTGHRCGVGLRLPHLAEILTNRPDLAWVEIHPENFVANPHAMEMLEAVAAHVAVSVHTVGISIGSAGGIDWRHFDRVRKLIDRIDPFLFSGHLAWSTHAGEYLNDLLPLPYDEQTLALLAGHVDQIQDAIGRRFLVENPSNYVGFGQSTLTEVEFLSELARRTGCLLLCDVSNIHVSAVNMGYDPYRYLDGLPAEAIGEMHLGGFVVEADGDGTSSLLIDTHSAPIAEEAWSLYAHAVRRFGHRPTLIEWDNELPDFERLTAEAARADAIARKALAQGEDNAVAA